MIAENQIQKEADKAGDVLLETNGVGKFTGLTYEEGVQAALEWVLKRNEDSPMED